MRALPGGGDAAGIRLAQELEQALCGSGGFRTAGEVAQGRGDQRVGWGVLRFGARSYNEMLPERMTSRFG